MCLFLFQNSHSPSLTTYFSLGSRAHFSYVSYKTSYMFKELKNIIYLFFYLFIQYVCVCMHMHMCVCLCVFEACTKRRMWRLEKDTEFSNRLILHVIPTRQGLLLTLSSNDLPVKRLHRYGITGSHKEDTHSLWMEKHFLNLFLFLV